MVKKLYHGSVKMIEKPLFGYGKPYNDYGLGFYCTDSLEMAKEWGVGKNQSGYANCYELDCDGLQILDLNAPTLAGGAAAKPRVRCAIRPCVGSKGISFDHVCRELRKL